MQTQKNTTIRSMTTVTKGPLPLAGHWLQSIYTQSLLDKHYPRAQPKPLQQQKGPLQVPDFKVYLRPFRCQIFTRYTPSKHSCQNTCKNKIFKAWCKGTSSLFCQELCSEIQGLCLAFGIVTKELSHEILMVLTHGIGNAHPKFLLAVFLATNVTLLCGTSQKKEEVQSNPKRTRNFGKAPLVQRHSWHWNLFSRLVGWSSSRLLSSWKLVTLSLGCWFAGRRGSCCKLEAFILSILIEFLQVVHKFRDLLAFEVRELLQQCLQLVLAACQGFPKGNTKWLVLCLCHVLFNSEGSTTTLRPFASPKNTEMKPKHLYGKQLLWSVSAQSPAYPKQISQL